jgi:hypothetical protein
MSPESDVVTMSSQGAVRSNDGSLLVTASWRNMLTLDADIFSGSLSLTSDSSRLRWSATRAVVKVAQARAATAATAAASRPSP